MRRLHAQPRKKNKKESRDLVSLAELQSNQKILEQKKIHFSGKRIEKKTKQTKKLFTVWWHRQFRVVVIVNPGWPFRVGYESWLEFCLSPGNIFFKKENTFCYLSPDSFYYQSPGCLISLSLSCTHTMVPDRLYNNNNNNYGVPRLSVFSLICATGTQFLRVSLTSQKRKRERVRRPGETRVGSACGPLVCMELCLRKILVTQKKKEPRSSPPPPHPAGW